MKLTSNFTLEEFERGNNKVPDCYLENIRELALELQKLRVYLGKPIKIHSGFRKPENNTGVSKSQHLLGKAADIKVPGMTPTEVHKAVLKLIREGGLKQGGVGLYPNSKRRKSGFVHYDIRGKAARWRSK
jgi:uncharacterized protein YcbK (DUF882 family)